MNKKKNTIMNKIQKLPASSPGSSGGLEVGGM